ncbi:MAG: acyltransferase family protein, partial [Flavobacteriales bacterium]
MKSGNHVTILDPMRGVAALAVVIFHYLGSVLPTLRPNGVEHIVEYGKLGVQVFFVISGFVIPYAMQRSGYIWSGWWRFMLRRFVRIAPPAYIAALAMIMFHLLSLVVNGRPIDGDPFPGFSFAAIFGNLTFTAEYLGVHWYNFVYWSLTVEFEFYLVIAAIMPLIARGSPTWRVVGVLLALLACQMIEGPKFFAYVHYFILGMLVFLGRETDMDKRILLAI